MQKQGILLVNLGSPDSPAEADVGRYLREFLMDGRVIDVPFPIRWLLVNCFIVPGRAAQSAHAYQSIWTEKGSPLVATGQTLAGRLRSALGMPVEIAMRYQHPPVREALGRLHAEGVSDLTVLPLFPQYAMSSYETAARHVEEEIRRHFAEMRVRMVPPFFEEMEYLDALASSAFPFVSEGFEHLLFSFHGLPERHLRKSDPTGRHCLQAANCCAVRSAARPTCYRAQCLATANGVARRLELESNQWSVAFQSRLGRDPWMQPYTEQRLKALASTGIKHLTVICPAFVADCLETLEEIAIRGEETFRAAGGEKLTMIPCLNDQGVWIEAISAILLRQLGVSGDELATERPVI